MTDQLHDALAQLDPLVVALKRWRAGDESVVMDAKAMTVILNAARKWMAVTESEPIQWCEVHEDGMVVGAMGGAMLRCHRGHANERCRFVSRLIVEEAVSDD